MGLIKELLDCAVVNIENNGQLGKTIGIAQIKQYQAFKEAGADDEEDVDEALEKYPNCEIKLGK